MNMIYFLRSAPYDYSVPGLNLYQSFNAVIRKEFQPSLLPGAQEYILHIVPNPATQVQKAYSSPDPRCIETATFLTKDVQSTPLLHEIGYVMEDFISEEEFFGKRKLDVTKARVAFVNALVADQLQESYRSVIERVSSFLKTLESDKATDIACVSHGFLLKVIETYIQHPEIERKPELLVKYFTGEKETFKFGEGFIAVSTGEKLQVTKEFSKQS